MFRGYRRKGAEKIRWHDIYCAWASLDGDKAVPGDIKT